MKPTASARLESAEQTSSGDPLKFQSDWQAPRFHAAAREHSGNKPLFISPPPAGRKITAGFSFLQRIGKEASTDIWFPGELQKELDQVVAKGGMLGPDNFPAEWAAVRQFELLQDAGNYKIYDMRADYLTRSIYEQSRSMRGGGYRVTVATIGSYIGEQHKDDLEILDKRLQKRISHLIHMLYLEEQSESINKSMAESLAAGTWDFKTALPHVGATLGARDLFFPVQANVGHAKHTLIIPRAPHCVSVATIPGWTHNFGVCDADYNQPFVCVGHKPSEGQYNLQNGMYQFARGDAGREVTITYLKKEDGTAKPVTLNAKQRKHKLTRQFFEILDLLPNQQILHDTAVGLQLPEMISEQEWIYLVASDETMSCFNTLLKDLFTPFDGINMAALDGRADAKPEIKATTQHMRGHGDRLTQESDQFYRSLAGLAAG